MFKPKAFSVRAYLAIGYSNGDHDEAARRSDIAAAYVMEKLGYAVFAPISQSHRVARYVEAGNLSHEFWLGQDRFWLDVCDVIFVVCDGNEGKSFGVIWEVGYMAAKGKTIISLKWEDIKEWHNGVREGG